MKRKTIIWNRVMIDLLDLAIVLVIAFSITEFIVSINIIPTGSMIPTINIRNRVITTQLPFYYRKPNYGEIVVFESLNNERWIKRIIGKPGDTIDIINGKVYRNGEKLDESAYLDDNITSEPLPGNTAQDFPLKIPQGKYFLMGDNRENSFDCRYTEVGLIAEDKILAKALVRVYPFNQIEPLE